MRPVRIVLVVIALIAVGLAGWALGTRGGYGQPASDDQGRLRSVSTHATASDAALAGYLEQARRLLAAHPTDEDGDGDLPGLSADFESLRWFTLPRACLTTP